MSQQDKSAKPPDFPIELWAMIVAMHYQDMRKNGPIEFYGMVVDSNGLPLPDVRIDVRLSSYHESIEKLREANRDKKVETIEVKTDKNGMFTISNRTGFGIVVSTFQKDGYELDETGTYGFNFSPEDSMSGAGERHVADPARPVVYSMRRTNL
jgi:hypothetical protein